MRFILITIISFLFCIRLSAQVYPVQATAQLIPPFTPYLSDYTKVGAQKFMLQIRLNDPIATSYPVKLRLTIEGVGITLRTKSSIFLNPITLQGGGIPQLLYGEDLEEYFRSANLDFSGLSRAQYEKNASLPEGVYRFTIEVLDYNRNTVVSNKATTTAWMMLNDPPMLNLPARETKIQLINPTNIPFTWTPRHTGSPNAAFTTEYTFRLVEMAPGTPSSLAQNAIQSQPTLYELTTNQTQIVYGMAEPALVPGRKYAWQVQAKDTDGRDLFKNDGRSEVYVFEFGDALGVPENMYLQSANASALTIRWEQNTLSSEQNFRLSYRPHQNRNTEQWYELQTAEQWKAITQLKPDTDYEVKVRSEQGTLLGEYNPIQIYRTVPLGANEFVCRSDVPPLSIPSVVFPIFGLSINDTIRAGGYDVLVRHVSGSNGAFYGDGVAIVPWFNSSKVRVTFENISVNSQFYLTAGVIKSVWDADSQFLLKVPPADSVAKPGSTPTAGDIPITIAATDSLIKISGAAIAAVTKDDEGNIVISTTDGNQQVLEKGKSYSVADDIGNGYIIDKDGNIAKTTAKAALAAAERGNRTYNIALKFQKGNGEYGFDELPQDAAKDILASYYQAMDDGNRISWKVLADGKRDVVNAATESTDLELKKISFELNGVPIKSMRTDKIELDLIGQGDGVSSELLAKYEGSDEVIGKLNVIHYKEIARTLVLVPVNDRQLKYASSLQTALNTIYKQAAVTWNVITDHGIQVSLDETFDDTADEVFSNYTDDMKKVINAYTKDHALAPDTYYLFLVDKPKSITKAGQLPRKKQAGFLFVDNLTSPELTIKTVAHELGHGAFRLEHTFKQFPSLTKQMTNNLMDYRPDGTYLYKYQWDYIHDPEAMLGLFEDDEDGAYETDGHYSTVYLIGKMLGVPNYKYLAWYTELPDNIIHDRYATVRTTWSERDHQLMTHALTWGYHNIEEFKTAVAFINADIKNFKELGRLLHRYGDCYAHTRIEDNLKKFMDKRMYGDTIKFPSNYLGITLEHFSVDGSKPDLIAERPDWYMQYVKNVTELMALKFNLDSKKVNFALFQELANYAKKNSVSLIGIMNYQIAKAESKKEFTVPYPKSNGTFLSDKAASDAQKSYKQWIKNTEDYLMKNGVKFESYQTVKKYYYDNDTL